MFLTYFNVWFCCVYQPRQAFIFCFNFIASRKRVFRWKCLRCCRTWSMQNLEIICLFNQRFGYVKYTAILLKWHKQLVSVQSKWMEYFFCSAIEMNEVTDIPEYYCCSSLKIVNKSLISIRFQYCMHHQQLSRCARAKAPSIRCFSLSTYLKWIYQAKRKHMNIMINQN